MEVDVKWLCLLLTTLAGSLLGIGTAVGRSQRQHPKTLQYRTYMQQLTIEIDHKVRTAAASIGASAFDLHSCAVQLYDTDMQMGHFFFTRPNPNHQLTDPTRFSNFFYCQIL